MSKSDELNIQKDLAAMLQQVVTDNEKLLDIKLDLTNELKSQVDLSGKMLALDEAKEKINKKFFGTNSDIGVEMTAQLDTIQKVIKEHKTYNDAWDITNEKVSGTASNIVDGIMGPIEKGLNMIPLIGGDLAKMLPTAELKDSLGKGLTNSVMGIKKAFGGMGAEGVVAMEGVGSAGVASGAATMAAFGPVIIILAAIAAAAMLVKAAFDYDKETTKIARDLGLAKKEAHHLQDEVEGISMKEPLATTHELLEATLELSKGFGGIAGINEQMIRDQAKLVKFMGMSNEQATIFQRISANNGQTAREMQGDVAASVESFNDATGAAVPLGKVMQGIADTSLVVRQNFKGGIKEIAQAVAQAQLLGTTVDQLASSTRGMLDIESSLSAQYSAQVLTGKQLNLDAIRVAKLKGDEGAAQRLLLKDIEGMGDQIGKNVIMTEEIAKAYGMTADELTKINDKQKHLKTLGVDLAGLNKMTSAEYRNQLDLKTDLSKEEKEKMIRDKESQSAGERMGKLWDAIGAAFDKAMVGPLAGVIDDMTKFLEDGSTLQTIFDVLGGVFWVIGKAVKFAFMPIKGVIDIIMGIKKALTDDLGGGLLQVGKGILEVFYAPFVMIWDILGDIATAIADAFDIEMPDWMKSIFGQDVSVTAEASAGTSPSSGGTNPEAVHDLIITPDGQTYKTHPDDFIIATKTPTKGAETTASGGGSGGGKVEELLQQLVSAVNQPTYIKFDDGTVQKVSNRSAFIGKMGANLGLG